MKGEYPVIRVSSTFPSCNSAAYRGARMSVELDSTEMSPQFRLRTAELLGETAQCVLGQ